MAKKNQINNIDKALESLQGALDIEPVGQEVQLPEQTVEFEPDIELTDLPDGGAEVNFDPNAPIDKSKIPFDGNLAEYIEEGELGKLKAPSSYYPNEEHSFYTGHYLITKIQHIITNNSYLTTMELAKDTLFTRLYRHIFDDANEMIFDPEAVVGLDQGLNPKHGMEGGYSE